MRPCVQHCGREGHGLASRMVYDSALKAVQIYAFFQMSKKAWKKESQRKNKCTPLYTLLYIYINNNKKIYVLDAKLATLASMRVAGCLYAVPFRCTHGHREKT